jgi:RNA polymerase sigma factor (TIGR02999 family)
VVPALPALSPGSEPISRLRFRRHASCQGLHPRRLAKSGYIRPLGAVVETTMADSSESSPEITVWLDAARGGDREALDRVLGTLYQELHTLARRQLSGQQNNTLDPTSLVHESYLKLVGASNGARFEDRAHFFAYAASAMRSVVVDYARNRMARKRGGDLKRVAEIPEEAESSLRLDENLLALDTALERLAAVDAKLAKVVELRYFAGLSELEIADLLQRSERSVRRDWQKARLFLLAAMRED